MARISSNQYGAFLGLSAMALYCLYDTAIKYLGQSYHPNQILFCAGLFALPMVLGSMRLSGQGLDLRPVLPAWAALRVAAALSNGILGAYAFAHLPLAECYAILFMMPLMIALLARPLLGERMDLPRGLAILVGLIGVLIALRPGAAPLSAGHLAAFLAMVLGALNYAILRKTGNVERAGVLVFHPLAAQVIAVALTMPWLWLPMAAAHIGLTALMAVAFTSGSLLMVAAYRRAVAIVVAPMQYSQIAWAAIFGAVFFGEAMDGWMVLGVALIIAAGLFILIRSGGAAPQASCETTPA
ncbi:MAG: DMT family transporter [Paracoccaceae bacterium]